MGQSMPPSWARLSYFSGLAPGPMRVTDTHVVRFGAVSILRVGDTLRFDTNKVSISIKVLLKHP